MTKNTLYGYNDIKILDAYLEEYHYNTEKLRDYFAVRDWEKYSKIVKRIRLSSKSVGANALYDEATLMEMAAGFDYKPYIMNHHEKLLRDYAKVRENIKRRILCRPRYIA